MVIDHVYCCIELYSKYSDVICTSLKVSDVKKYSIQHLNGLNTTQNFLFSAISSITRD